MYKLLHGQISSSLTTALSYAKCSTTRGHKYKLFVSRCKKLIVSTFFNLCDTCLKLITGYMFNIDILRGFKNSLTKVDFSGFI